MVNATNHSNCFLICLTLVLAQLFFSAQSQAQTAEVGSTCSVGERAYGVEASGIYECNAAKSSALQSLLDPVNGLGGSRLCQLHCGEAQSFSLSNISFIRFVNEQPQVASECTQRSTGEMHILAGADVTCFSDCSGDWPVGSSDCATKGSLTLDALISEQGTADWCAVSSNSEEEDNGATNWCREDNDAWGSFCCPVGQPPTGNCYLEQQRCAATETSEPEPDETPLYTPIDEPVEQATTLAICVSECNNPNFVNEYDWIVCIGFCELVNTMMAGAAGRLAFCNAVYAVMGVYSEEGNLAGRSIAISFFARFCTV